MMLGGDYRACFWRGAFALMFLAMFAAACSTDERAPGELAQGCNINSDCRSPLVCAFRACHNACTASRDCPAGLRCVASDRPFYVCQLPTEVACTRNTSCPEGQVCGVDGQCRDQCKAAADCLAGQLCVSGTCAESRELKDGGLVPSSNDAAPSSGQTCSYNSQCPAPMICRDGACQIECLSSTDCKSGRQCVDSRCQVPLCPEVDAGTGTRCSFSSECAAPLVCKSGICTCECRGSGDCASGYDCTGNRCVPGSVDTTGPEGGIVVSPDHRLTLEVPAGALATRVHLTIELAGAWPAGALGPVFEVRPSGTTFAVPATFVYRYLPADIAPVAPPNVRLAVASGATWTRLATDVDATSNTATSHVTHLSTYGLVGPESMPDASVDAGDGGDADRCAVATC